MDEMRDINSLIEQISNLKNNEIFKFQIHVNASAKSNSIEFIDNLIKIRIKEKAVGGKANKAIIEYLSDILKIPKRYISISCGQTSRIKTIQVKFT